MASEIEILLQELRSMKTSDQARIQNTRDTWSKIGAGNWAEAGFVSEEEAMTWLENNEYANLSN